MWSASQEFQEPRQAARPMPELGTCVAQEHEGRSGESPHFRSGTSVACPQPDTGSGGDSYGHGKPDQGILG